MLPGVAQTAPHTPKKEGWGLKVASCVRKGRGLGRTRAGPGGRWGREEGCGGPRKRESDVARQGRKRAGSMGCGLEGCGLGQDEEAWSRRARPGRLWVWSTQGRGLHTMWVEHEEGCGLNKKQGRGKEGRSRDEILQGSMGRVCGLGDVSVAQM